MLARFPGGDYNVPMARALLALVAFLAGGLPAAALADEAGPAEELERVVAVIRPPAATQAIVVTRTRLEAETRIALVSRGAALAATRPLDLPALRAGLEWIIDQSILGEEAERLHVSGIVGADVRAELERFKARFERPSAYEAFLEQSDLSPGELEEVLRRMLRVDRYVESRVGRSERGTHAEVKALLRDLRVRTEVRILDGPLRAAASREPGEGGSS
jgi:hypothetical protein